MPVPQNPTPRRRSRPPKQVARPVEPVMEEPVIPTTAEEPVAPSATTAAPAVPQPPTTVPRPAQLFRAVRAPIHHPYQNVLVPVGRSVPLILDNWVEVQLAAKVIEKA